MDYFLCNDCGDQCLGGPDSTVCNTCVALRRIVSVCAECGELFTRRIDGKGRRPLRCERCADRRERERGRSRHRIWSPVGHANSAPCAECGALLYGSRSSLPSGTRRCQACRASDPVKSRNCAVCNQPFLAPSRSSTSKTCSRICGRRVAADTYRSTHPLLPPSRRTWLKFNERGRAITSQSGALYERIDRELVYRRDSWACGICGDAIDSTLTWPHIMFKSVDHIVPLSEGGAHTYGNVQAAHWLCNCYKGNDPAFDLRVNAQ